MISSNWQCHIKHDSWKYQEGAFGVMPAVNIAKESGFPARQMYAGDFLPLMKNLMKDAWLPDVAGWDGGSRSRELAHRLLQFSPLRY